MGQTTRPCLERSGKITGSLLRITAAIAAIQVTGRAAVEAILLTPAIPVTGRVPEAMTSIPFLYIHPRRHHLLRHPEVHIVPPRYTRRRLNLL